jgi:hypothetical protein
MTKLKPKKTSYEHAGQCSMPNNMKADRMKAYKEKVTAEQKAEKEKGRLKENPTEK